MDCLHILQHWSWSVSSHGTRCSISVFHFKFGIMATYAYKFNCKCSNTGHGIENFLVLHTYIPEQGLTAGPFSMDLLLALPDDEYSFHLNAT